MVLCLIVSFVVDAFIPINIKVVQGLLITQPMIFFIPELASFFIVSITKFAAVELSVFVGVAGWG